MMLINKSYNFTTLAPVILGANYTNMKVIAILNSKEAIKYRDIKTLHDLVSKTITSLPKSTVDLTYYLFENENNEKLVFALEYIEPTSIVQVQTVNIRIDVKNTTTEDLALLRKYLVEVGYNNFDIYTY